MHIPRRVAPQAAILVMAIVAFAQLRPDVTPGNVVILTTPRAAILLDEAELGAATSGGSYTIHGVKPGPHTLRITKEGKHPFTQRIMVAAGTTSQIRAELGDVTGDLEVLTTAGAQIFLNGKSAGVADGTGKLLIRGLNEPHYKIRAAKAGRTSEEQQISLSTNMVSSVNLDLKLADEVHETAASSPPDYVLQRRLVPIEGAGVREIFFQASSGQLISISQNGETGYITQWDASTGRLLKTVELKSKDRVLAVSPDLRFAALELCKPRPAFNNFPLPSENSVRLVEAATERVIRVWPGYSADFTPDSNGLIITAYDQPGAVTWDIESGKKLETWPEAEYWSNGHPPTTETVALYSPDGRRVATTSDKGVVIRDAETGKVIQRLPTQRCCKGAAFSPDDRWLAVMNTGGPGPMELWEISTGRQRRTFVSPPLVNHLAFYGAVFTPDAGYIVSFISSDGWDDPPEIRILDTFTGREMRKWPAKNPKAISLSRDGRWLALLDHDSSIAVWKRAD